MSGEGQDQDQKKSTRTNIIKAVTSPLGFFTLSILIIESIFLALLATEKTSEWIPFILFLVVVGFVFVLAIFKPEAFYQSGDRRLVEDKKRKIRELENKLKGLEKGGFEKFRLILDIATFNGENLTPTAFADFAATECIYSILDGNKVIIKNESVIIHTDITITTERAERKIIPYIDVSLPSQLADPSVRITLIFKNHNWNLYGCRIKQRIVELS